MSVSTLLEPNSANIFCGSINGKKIATAEGIVIPSGVTSGSVIVFGGVGTSAQATVQVSESSGTALSIYTGSCFNGTSLIGNLFTLGAHTTPTYPSQGPTFSSGAGGVINLNIFYDTVPQTINYSIEYM